MRDDNGDACTDLSDEEDERGYAEYLATMRSEWEREQLERAHQEDEAYHAMSTIAAWEDAGEPND